MTTIDHPTAGPEPTLAARLFAHLADQQLDRVALLFEPDADLRALLPGGLLVGEGSEDIREMFALWFGEVHELEVIDTHADRVGPRLHLRWRVRLRGDRFGPRPLVLEQSAYADLAPSGRMRTMSLVCSGYVREGDDG